MDANGKIRVLGPMVVRPATTTWLISSHSSPSVTSGPTTQYGPIFTPAPSLAPDSTMAVGWIWASANHVLDGLCLGSIVDHGADLGLRRDVAIDPGLAVEPPRAAAAADLAHVEEYLVPRQHWLAELGLVDAHEVDKLRPIVLAEIMHAQGAGGLRHAFDDEDTRHDGISREV